MFIIQFLDPIFRLPRLGMFPTFYSKDYKNLSLALLIYVLLQLASTD